MLKRDAPEIELEARLSCVHAFACYCPGRGWLLVPGSLKQSFELLSMSGLGGRGMLADNGGGAE